MDHVTVVSSLHCTLYKCSHKFLICVLFGQFIIFLYVDSSFISLHILLKNSIFSLCTAYKYICSASSLPAHKGQLSLYIPVRITFNI